MEIAVDVNDKTSPLGSIKDARFRIRRRNGRKTFLQDIADKGQTEKVFGRPLIMRTRCLLAHRWPVAGGIIIPPQPRQRHEIDLLVFGQ